MSRHDNSIINENTSLENQQYSIISEPISHHIIEYCPSIKGFVINGCVNRNIISSMLFIIPAIYGYIISWFLVSICSLICLFTSIINHYHSSEHKLFRPLDIIFVNSIGLYFLIFTIYTIGVSFYTKLMYIFSIITVSIYLYIRINPHLYKKYYFFVHVYAVIGIMLCIKSYDIHFNSNLKYTNINNNDNNNDNNNTIVHDMKLSNIT